MTTAYVVVADDHAGYHEVVAVFLDRALAEAMVAAHAEALDPREVPVSIEEHPVLDETPTRVLVHYGRYHPDAHQATMVTAASWSHLAEADLEVREEPGGGRWAGGTDRAAVSRALDEAMAERARRS